jgi:hypothetical protein
MMCYNCCQKATPKMFKCTPTELEDLNERRKHHQEKGKPAPLPELPSVEAAEHSKFVNACKRQWRLRQMGKEDDLRRLNCASLREV